MVVVSIRCATSKVTSYGNSVYVVLGHVYGDGNIVVDECCIRVTAVTCFCYLVYVENDLSLDKCFAYGHDYSRYRAWRRARRRHLWAFCFLRFGVSFRVGVMWVFVPAKVCGRLCTFFYLSEFEWMFVFHVWGVYGSCFPGLFVS